MLMILLMVIKIILDYVDDPAHGHKIIHDYVDVPTHSHNNNS